jgi:hypothetical protein
MTGTGRTGRKNQASLTAIAAAKIGWHYPTLLPSMLKAGSTLCALIDVKISKEFAK